MTLPILYSFRRCPYAMRARLALAAAQIKCELREVVLRDKPDAMLQASAKGEVPVLVLGDKVLDESRDIIFWALEQNDPHNWLAGFTPEHKKLLELFDDKFKHHLDRYKYATRYDTNATEHRNECVKILTELEPQLKDNWLAGSEVGLIDIAILPFVRQFRIADPDWFDNEPALARTRAWLTRFLNWQDFQSVMGKHKQWHEGAPTTIFPPEI